MTVIWPVLVHSVYSFVSEKVELMLGETKLVELIHLFRGNLMKKLCI